MNLSDFLLTPIHILAPPENEACSVCHKPVRGETDYEIDGKFVHDDCFFLEPSNVAERSSLPAR